MNPDTLLVAMVVAIPTTVAAIVPIATLIIQGRQRTKDKLEDYARQDAVAEKAAEAASVVEHYRQRQEEIGNTTIEKLETIHTLVNSNMTAAIQSELDATIRELGMMHEVIALNRTAGRDPSPAAIKALEATEKKIEELKATLEDRIKQQDLVTAAQEKGPRQ